MTFNLRVFWGGESAPQGRQKYVRLLHSSSATWAERLSLKGVNIEQYAPQACPTSNLGGAPVLLLHSRKDIKGWQTMVLNPFFCLCLLHWISNLEKGIKKVVIDL